MTGFFEAMKALFRKDDVHLTEHAVKIVNEVVKEKLRYFPYVRSEQFVNLPRIKFNSDKLEPSTDFAAQVSTDHVLVRISECCGRVKMSIHVYDLAGNLVVDHFQYLQSLEK